MADTDEENLSREEILLRKHKIERKELQGQIQKLKHSVSKGDKKKKKEVTAQCAILEAELDEKHEKELEEIKSAENEVNGLVDKVSDMTTDAGSPEAAATADDDDEDKPQQSKKPSRAQKRRNKKAAQEKERAKMLEEDEANNVNCARNVEARKLKALLNARLLDIYEMPSDGNCLYSAVEDQLKRIGVQTSMSSLRKQTADHMLEHQDDFLPFLTNPDTGLPYTAEDYEKYCGEIESTAAWGGQLEIRALANVLRLPIEVIQAEGPSLITGEEFHNGDMLKLTYHRHAYGLGEHYNSVQPKVEPEEDEFS